MTDQLFEDKSDQLFEPLQENSFVDVHIEWSVQGHLAIDNVGDNDKKISIDEAWPGTASFDEYRPNISLQKETCGVLRDDPPRYSGQLGLDVQSFSDPQELKRMAYVSASSYQRQFGA